MDILLFLFSFSFAFFSVVRLCVLQAKIFVLFFFFTL